MKYTKQNICLKQGDIYLFKDGLLKATTDESYKDIIDCYIDRKAFVKPVDVSKLAHESADLCYGNVDLGDYKYGFKAGYNANPNEFNLQDMATLWGIAFDFGRANKNFKGIDFEKAIASFRPLSIPESVTIENNQVIEVKW